MAKLLRYGFIFLLFFSLFVGYLFYSFCKPIVTQKEGVVYYLHPGTSPKILIATLAKQGFIRFPLFFFTYVELSGRAQLKTGEYLFPQGSSSLSIWRQVTEGKGFVYHEFTIIPGWTFKQLRLALAQTQNLRPTLQNLDDKQLMLRLGYKPFSPEGEFFPETYYYTKDVPDLVILKRAIDYMQKKLNEAWLTREPNLPYQNAYEALIAASLIEKEAYLAAERPIIAGVLINRLRKNMRLQFDPTVIYGMGEHYQGKIYKQNLLEDTAYNTYVHKGLPPTPIAMPSFSAIDAALHPQHHEYYYFVAKGDGSHQFSKTLAEHNKAVVTSSQRGKKYFNEALMKRYIENILRGQS